MRALILALVLTSYGPASAQLNIHPTEFIAGSPGGIETFSRTNGFDYALFTWSTSNWIRKHTGFRALVKQGRKWYLVQLYSLENRPDDIPKILRTPVPFRYVEIQRKRADSLLKAWKPGEVFSRPLIRYSELGDGCAIGDSIQFAISDAGEIHVAEYTQHTTRYVYKYAAHQLLEHCASDQKYLILRDLVRTWEGLYRTIGKIPGLIDKQSEFF